MQASAVASLSEAPPGVTQNVWHQEQLVLHTSYLRAVRCLHTHPVSMLQSFIPIPYITILFSTHEGPMAVMTQAHAVAHDVGCAAF